MPFFGKNMPFSAKNMPFPAKYAISGPIRLFPVDMTVFRLYRIKPENPALITFKLSFRRR
jgi:hypothetical protein